MGKNASALRPRERGGKSCHRAARSQRGHSAAEISLLDRSAVKKNHFSLSAGFISQRGAEIPAKNRKIRFIHVMTAYDVMALFWERLRNLIGCCDCPEDPDKPIFFIG